MPITLHTPPTLYKMKKQELISHIDDLTEFIYIFSGEDIQDLANQIRDLKAENKILQSKSFKHYDAMEKLIEDEAKRVEKVMIKITKRDNKIKERDNQIKELLQEIGTGKKLLKESKEWGTKLVEEMEKIKKDCCSKEIYDSVCKENQELLEEIDKLKEEIVNIAKMKNKQIKKEKDKYESMCSEQAKSDCAKQIEKLKIKLQNREEMMRDRIDERDTFQKSLREAEQEVKKQKEVVIQLQKFQAVENDAKDIRCVNKIAEEVQKNRELTKQNKYLKEEIERLESS